MFVIGDYVRISPTSHFHHQEKTYGKAGKIVKVADFVDGIWYSVKFSHGRNGYQEDDLIKISKFDWIKRSL
jgi:hypothetical protein